MLKGKHNIFYRIYLKISIMNVSLNKNMNYINSNILSFWDIDSLPDRKSDNFNYE